MNEVNRPSEDDKIPLPTGGEQEIIKRIHYNYPTTDSDRLRPSCSAKEMSAFFSRYSFLESPFKNGFSERREDDLSLITSALYSDSQKNSCVYSLKRKLIILKNQDSNGGCINPMGGVPMDENKVKRQTKLYRPDYHFLYADILASGSDRAMRLQHHEYSKLTGDIKNEEKEIYAEATIHFGVQEHTVVDDRIDTKLLDYWLKLCKEYPSWDSLSQEIKAINIQTFASKLVKKTRKTAKYKSHRDLVHIRGEWLLSDTIESGVAVCRHTALLLHYLLGKAQIHSRLRNGIISARHLNKWQMHMWAEAMPYPGQKQLVDISAIDYNLASEEEYFYYDYASNFLYKVRTNGQFPYYPKKN